MGKQKEKIYCNSIRIITSITEACILIWMQKQKWSNGNANKLRIGCGCSEDDVDDDDERVIIIRSSQKFWPATFTGKNGKVMGNSVHND